VFTALVTPFRDGAVDERALHEAIELQIAAGVDGIVPCGSTGEAATLSHA
jgi:4-hydroxy-tetrahydrodipicolinate synthase